MDAHDLVGQPMETRFQVAFPGRPFTQRTVQDHRYQWFSMSTTEEKDDWIQLGRVDKALWPLYMRQHRIKDLRV